ncbi:MAG: hypothetical protein JW913_03810 [Chitinispirillaceae bacterium]|nr:hypothetical protein [Chitinispirillaceae bacterium]
MTITALLCFVAASWAKTDVPLFLFSGQSNMVGMGASVSDLSGDQKDDVENVKIYQETEGVHKGKWLTLGPGFGNDNKHFGPELFFGKTLSDSMPDLKIAFIKDAKSGTWLGKSSEWLPPSSGGPGNLYKNMMNHIDAALKKFNDAFDTSEYTPRWAGFIWHQGEFDAMGESFTSTSPTLANKYEVNLTNLVKDIREMTEVEDLPAIIPMIDVQSMWPYASIVRDAEVAVAKKLDNCDTMETKGLPTDGIHYKAAGMVKIGQICAIRWLAMEFTKDWWKPDTIPVPVVYRSTPSTTSAVPYSLSNFAFFDLAGRKTGNMTLSPNAPNAGHIRYAAPALVIIENANTASGERHFRRMLNMLR